MWLQEHLTSFREMGVGYYEMQWESCKGEPKTTFGSHLTDCVLGALSEE